MIVQSENETRLEYLSRVLTEMMNRTYAGEATIDYDETTCDGSCLADDIASEVESLKQLQATNKQLLGALESLLSAALTYKLTDSDGCVEDARDAIANAKGE